MINPLEFARLVESAYRTKQRDTEGVLTISPDKCTGKTLYSNYKKLFDRFNDNVCEFIEQNGLTIAEFFKEIGIYFYDNGYKLNQNKSVLRSILGTDAGTMFIVKQVLNKKKLDSRYKMIMKSILYSIQYLSRLTLRKNMFSKPSVTLINIFKTRTLSNYIGDNISYYFLALIPRMDEVIDKIADTCIDINNPRKKIMSPEFSKFKENLPAYRQDAVAACKHCRFESGNILEIADDYYLKHKVDIAKLEQQDA